MEIKIKVEPDARAKALASPEFRRRLLSAMAMAARESVQIAATEVSQRTPVGVTGDLARVGTSVQILSNKVEGHVFPQQKYAIFVEKGTRAPRRMPPLDAIENWVHYRLRITDPKKKRRAAWGIRIKIGSETRKGIKMFQKGYKASIARVRQTFQHHIKKALS